MIGDLKQHIKITLHRFLKISLMALGGPLVLSLHFNGHFPGEPGLAGGLLKQRMMEDGGGGDNWSYKSFKAPVKSSPPTNQHPVFYRPDALPVAQPTVSKH